MDISGVNLRGGGGGWYGGQHFAIVFPYLRLHHLPGLLHGPEPPLHSHSGRRHPPVPGSDLDKKNLLIPLLLRRIPAGTAPAQFININTLVSHLTVSFYIYVSDTFDKGPPCTSATVVVYL